MPADATNVEFTEWCAVLLKLSPEERASALAHDEAFRRSVMEVRCRHHYRYLTLLLPCAIYDPNGRLGIALCDALLAAYGSIAASAIPAGELLHLQGNNVVLACLITEMTQHAHIRKQIAKKYVLFHNF